MQHNGLFFGPPPPFFLKQLCISDCHPQKNETNKQDYRCSRCLDKHQVSKSATTTCMPTSRAETNIKLHRTPKTAASQELFLLNTSSTSAQMKKIMPFPQFYRLSEIHPLFWAPPKNFVLLGMRLAPMKEEWVIRGLGWWGFAFVLLPPVASRVAGNGCSGSSRSHAAGVCSMQSLTAHASLQIETKPSLLLRGSSEGWCSMDH